MKDAKPIKTTKPLIPKKCEYCKNDFMAKRKNKTTCSGKCWYNLNRSKNYAPTDTMVECAVCKMKSNDLTSHISRTHKMKIADYKTFYNAPIRSEAYLKDQSDRVKGDKNPAYQHGGKFSALSDKFVHAETTDKEAVKAKISKSSKENGNSECTLLYWLKQGYSEAEAKAKLSERQTTFSLEICIEKYGEEEGRKRWQARQEKWIASFNNKSPEELERIARARGTNGLGFSKISQKMFISIIEHLKGEKFYFATCDNGEIVECVKNHHEYFHISPSTGKKFFLDFYYPKTKAVVEFDGDYWHGEERGNKERDLERHNNLVQDGFRLLHITEKEYKQNPTGTINKCLEFLKNE